MYGQDVYFLGFPYGLHGDMSALSNDLPFPFVKKGIISLFHNDGVNRIYLDGHNNPGFSGGPVVFMPAGLSDFMLSAQVALPTCSKTTSHMALLVIFFTSSAIFC